MLRPSSEGICGGNKFRSVSWKNISVSLFLGEFGAGLVLCLASMSKENEGLRIEKPLKQVGGSRACKYLASICKMLFGLALIWFRTYWKAGPPTSNKKSG